MNLIVVVDKNWGIGKKNGLLFRLPKDMAFFKKTTMGRVVVMGANTFKSFPRGALPQRINVVLDDSGATYPNTHSVSTIEQLRQVIGKYYTENVFVIGGASLYSQLLSYCKKAYVTKVDADGGAEVFFPNLDEQPSWQLCQQSDVVQDGAYDITFCTYTNNDVQTF